MERTRLNRGRKVWIAKRGHEGSGRVASAPFTAKGREMYLVARYNGLFAYTRRQLETL